MDIDDRRPDASRRRRVARLALLLLGSTLLCGASTHAQGTEASLTEDSLDMADAMRLAIDAQPLLLRLEAKARAARETAIAAAQLPDPRLFGGVRDLPIDTGDAYSLTRDSDTQLVVGLQQEVPAAAKRRLRKLERVREAERLDAERTLTERVVKRNAALAWLDVWRNERAQELIDARVAEARLEVAAMAIAAASARATQGQSLAAEVALEQLRDESIAGQQTIDASRSQLRRWIGDAAAQPIAAGRLPDFAQPPALDDLLTDLSHHPQMRALEAQIVEARVGAALAAAGQRPDWRVEVGYGHRREYSDMVMLQVGVDLPLFPGQRQNRQVEGALALQSAAESEREDGYRQLMAEAERIHRDLVRLNERTRHYDEALLPKSAAVVAATFAAWRTGRAPLTSVLAIRRADLDIRLARLDLERDTAARRIELDYLRTTGAEP